MANFPIAQFTYNDPNAFSLIKKMQADAALQQKQQDEQALRAYTEQDRALKLQQAQMDLENSQKGLGKNVPAALQVWNAVQGMNPEQRQLFLASQGRLKVMNLGNRSVMVDPTTGEIISEYSAGIAPKEVLDAMGNRMILGGGNYGSAGGYAGDNINQGATMPPQSGAIDQELNNLSQTTSPTMLPQQGGMQPNAMQGAEQQNATMPSPAVRYVNGKYYNQAGQQISPKQAELLERKEAAIAQKQGEIKAENQIKAQADLDQITSDAAFAIKTIQDLKNSPGLPAIVGQPFSISKARKGGAGYLGELAGTPAANAVTFLGQIKGQAFLDAYDRLRGGGAITKEEGDKATAAKARLDRAQDYDSFVSALNDLEEIFSKAQERAYKKADLPLPQSTQMQGQVPVQGQVKTPHGTVYVTPSSGSK